MSEEARKNIAGLFKIVDSHSILVIVPAGKIKKLYCPFMVICNVDFSTLQKGKEY
jgi:hypothetical protein